MSSPSASSRPSTWALLRSPVFRAVWLGALFSNIGGLLHETAAAWTMASLAEAPVWVTLLQTAMSLPLFLLGLPAGALGDLVSPRRVLLRSEPFLAVVATVIGVVAYLGWMDAPLLLVLTALIGIGTAFSLPAWQSLLPELVRKEEIPAAVALNGLSLNLARAIGPASAGLLLSATGPAVCFALNGLSFAVVSWVLWRGARDQPARPRAQEPFLDALVAGARYVRHAPLLRTVMLRMVGFVFPASGVIALFPLLARREWGLGPAGFGLFMTAYGLGAVLAATWIPQLRQRFPLRTLLAAAAASFTVFGLILALAPGGYALLAVMPLGGAGWICTLATLNASAQAASAPWVRGRALAFNLLVSQGGIAFGALCWGLVAGRWGVPTALLAAVALLVSTTLMLHRRDFERVRRLDLDPAGTWPEPLAALQPDAHRLPASVTVDYRIDPGQRSAFLTAVRDLGIARRRTGALHWEIAENPEEPGWFQERFTLATWDEHLRQHARITRSDAELEARVDAFHRGPTPPVVRHWLSPRA
jgi:MFS family permease